MRARWIVVAGAVFAGGMLAAASAQEGRPFDALRASLTSLTHRVATLEQESQQIPALTSETTLLSTRVSTLEQESQAIPQLNSETKSLSARVSVLEQQQSQAIPGLKVIDAAGQFLGRADISTTSFAVTLVDGVAVALPVSDAGFRQAVGTQVWFQSTDCSGDPFLTNDTGVIRQAQVVGTSALYGKGQFRSVLFRSRRAYPAGSCSASTFTATGAEMGAIDVSGYRAPFAVIE